MTVELKPTELVTPPLRLAFPSLFEPRATAKGGTDLKYQCVILIPPETDLKPFAKCMKAAMIDAFGQAIALPGRKNPVNKCEEKEPRPGGYEDGWRFINIKGGYKPNVVDQDMQPVMDRGRVYPGCWCRFHINAFGWTHEVGGKGVSFSLESVQLVHDDDRLDSKRSADDVFEAVAPEDDVVGLVANDDDVEALFG